MKTVFLRVLEAEDKAEALLEAIRAPELALGDCWFEVDPKSFAGVPRSPFAYWVSDRLRALFKELPPFEAKGRAAKQGLATADDFRFVRAWWEVAEEGVGKRWFPFAKGGKFSPFYADVHMVVNWSGDGGEDKAYIVQRYPYLNGNAAYVAKNTDYYFRPGLTWPVRARRFAPQVLPAQCVFSHRGYSCFLPREEILACMGLFNSSTFDFLFKVTLGRAGYPEFLAGLLPMIPMPRAAMSSEAILSSLARRGWSLKRAVDTSVETSHAFTLPALLQAEGSGLAARANAWSQHVRAAEVELARIQSEVDERCLELYGIGEVDRPAISDGFGAGVPDDASSEAADDDEDALVAEREMSEASVKAVTLAAELTGWAVGVAFGRFDVSVATGERTIPPEPEPFDPLPACSPGMLTDDGLAAQEVPEAYPLGLSPDGIMVDDAGHSKDLATRVREVFGAAFGVEADAWWQECVRLLGDDLRRWLAVSFFETHLKSHSKSRRKAPIYWQLATPTSSYSVWVYAHRANSDTLFRVLNDFVTPKLRHEERKLTGLIQETGPSPSASQRKDIESQRDFVEELRSFRVEAARVAPLWRPELDDGILIACAPLWRLVPQHRVWQREAKACWTKLTKGEFDWAHLAMHLWPERVVPKCAHDRSLAIAHGLEEEFWAEDADGKWASRQVDSPTVERLVQERSSAAVKAALADLVAAG